MTHPRPDPTPRPARAYSYVIDPSRLPPGYKLGGRLSPGTRLINATPENTTKNLRESARLPNSPTARQKRKH